jgi:ubiquinone/menaquinone biosynthesis C-methylase UbiE
MGLWQEHVVPRIVDKACDTADVHEARARVCAGLHGDVLEIGFGSGLNVRHYPSTVTGVWAVDPSAVARRLGSQRITASRVPVEMAGLDGQRLDLPNDRFDSALSTYTLCTIPDPDAALSEVLRVLIPGGTFRFIEHGRSPDSAVLTWQRRLEPVNRRVAGGCHLTRQIDELVTSAGFEIEALDTYYAAKGPKPFGWIFEGSARKPADAA